MMSEGISGYLRCWRPDLKVSLATVLWCVLIAVPPLDDAFSGQPTTAALQSGEPLDSRTLEDLKSMYSRLIDAENQHDLKAVRRFLWTSPEMLFVAKTKTAAEGNWAGFWGTDVVMQHFHDLYQGPSRSPLTIRGKRRLV